MLTKKQNLTREILTVILLLAAVAATEYWFFQLWRLDWHVPMFYGGDGIYWVGQVQRSYGELSGSLGWPFYEVAGRYDPNYDLIYDIFVWFVGLFTKDTGTVFNLYVLVIPFANALAGYAVFRMVGLRRWLSFAFGLTFGLTPYVQQRMAGHMMLAACEFVPFSVLLCLWCAEDEQFNRPGRGFFKNKRNWLALAMAVLLCKLRAPISRLPQRVGAVVAVALATLIACANDASSPPSVATATRSASTFSRRSRISRLVARMPVDSVRLPPLTTCAPR